MYSEINKCNITILHIFIFLETIIEGYFHTKFHTYSSSLSKVSRKLTCAFVPLPFIASIKNRIQHRVKMFFMSIIHTLNESNINISLNIIFAGQFNFLVGLA